MGGGTGTGAAPVVAQIAKDLGILTIAVVTKPFNFEGKTRQINTERGINELRKYVDSLVVIPNEKLLQIVPEKTTLYDAFRYADDVLRQGIQGISDLIVFPGLINIDFADIQTVMRNKGLAHMGVGTGKGDNKTLDAVRQAVSSPLLETTIEGATSVVLNVKGGNDITLKEVNEAASMVREVIDKDCNLIFGSSLNPEMSDEVEITIIATGFKTEKTEDVHKREVSDAVSTISVFANNNRPYNPIDIYATKKEEPTVDPTQVEIERDENKSTSVVGVRTSTSTPPWIEKLRNKNKRG